MTYQYFIQEIVPLIVAIHANSHCDECRGCGYDTLNAHHFGYPKHVCKCVNMTKVCTESHLLSKTLALKDTD